MYPTKATIPVELVAATKKMSHYPIDEMNGFKMTQGFGINLTPFYAEMGIKGHNGVDIRAETGTPIYSVFDHATVVNCSKKATAGIFVSLATDGITIKGYEGVYRISALYFHLENYTVSIGDHVTGGQRIGTTDNTGKYTTGPHLHFAIYIEKLVDKTWVRQDRDNGFDGAVDPEAFFPDKTYQVYPVDYRYGQKVTVLETLRGNLYKKAITPWLTRKFERPPTERELNAFAYGYWDFEYVSNPAFFSKWVNITKPEFKASLGKPMGF